MKLVVFRIDGQSHGVPLERVDQVIPAVEVSHLSDAPHAVLGLIDVRGEVVPVLDTRRRLGLVPRAVGIHDHFVLVRSAQRRMALVVDEVVGVVERMESEVEREFPREGDRQLVAGVTRLADGLMVIYSLDQFLGNEDDRQLDAAMKAGE